MSHRTEQVGISRKACLRWAVVLISLAAGTGVFATPMSSAQLGVPEPSDVALVGPTSVALPHTFEFVTSKADFHLTAISNGTPLSPATGSISGPDASGLYHHFRRIDQAFVGTLTLRAQTRGPSFLMFQQPKEFTIAVTSNALPDYRFTAASIEQALRFGRGNRITGEVRFFALKPGAGMELRVERQGRAGFSGRRWQVYKRVGPSRGGHVSASPIEQRLRADAVLSCTNIAHMQQIGWKLRLVVESRLGPKGKSPKDVKRLVQTLKRCAA